MSAPVPFYCFAYGSNLPYLRMLERSSRDLILKGKLAWKAQRLTFAKRGDDGSGKCTAITAATQEVVWGVVYQLTPNDREQLAKFEGDYHEVSILFPIDGERRAGYTYVADHNRIDLRLRPYEWYKRLVLAGAREHAFPEAYIEALESVKAQPDPDAMRRARYQALLDTIEKAPQSGVADLTDFDE